MSKQLPALFVRLRELRAFRREHLPFIATLEDFALASEVGYRQAAGTPLTMNEALRLEIGSVATLQRQIRRLRDAGAIAVERSDGDGRVVIITLTPKALKAFAAYGQLLGI